MFLLEVLDVANNIILANVTSSRPQFTITGLNPGRDLRLVIYAENRNGKSSVITIDGFTSKVAQLKIGKIKSEANQNYFSTTGFIEFVSQVE